MTFIGGDFKIVEPAKPVVMTPEQEAAAEAKRQRAKALRAERKRQQAEGIEVAPVAEQIAEQAENQSPEPQPERQRMPWQSQGERQRVDLNDPEDGPRLPDESKWPLHPETGFRVSPKHYARLMQERAEREASDRGDFEPAGKMAFLNKLASDDEYQAAKRAFEHAEAYQRQLEREQAGFGGQMQDAINSYELDRIGQLRARQRELPDLIFAAKMGTAEAGRAFAQLKAARERVAKGEARSNANNALAELRELEAKTREIQYAVTDAETRYSDAVAEVGAWNRQLDALKAEALAMAVGPGYRTFAEMAEDGGEMSPYRPMARS